MWMPVYRKPNLIKKRLKLKLNLKVKIDAHGIKKS